MAGGIGGTAAGFALGTIFMPGVGSAIGAIGGGIVGGYAGKTVVSKTYETLEKSLDNYSDKQTLRDHNAFAEVLDDTVKPKVV